MPTTRINNAIQDCLSRCRGSETPLATLAHYCHDLREARWTGTEIRLVETTVVRLLGAISDDD